MCFSAINGSGPAYRISILTNIGTQFLLQSVCVCVCTRACVRVCSAFLFFNNTLCKLFW